jgi:hypothetical protein
MMTKDFKDLLKALNAHAVKYLLIGGHAFGVHAQPRATGDVDIFIRSRERKSRLQRFGRIWSTSPRDEPSGFYG